MPFCYVLLIFFCKWKPAFLNYLLPCRRGSLLTPFHLLPPHRVQEEGKDERQHPSPLFSTRTATVSKFSCSFEVVSFIYNGSVHPWHRPSIWSERHSMITSVDKASIMTDFPSLLTMILLLIELLRAFARSMNPNVFQTVTTEQERFAATGTQKVLIKQGT